MADEVMPTSPYLTSAFDEDRRRNIEITPWDREFYNVDQSEIFDIVLAANYLDIKQLL